MSEGDLIIGNCKLLTCLATGNQTQVWEVVEQGSNEKYAMKLLLPEAFKDVAQKNALKHEAKVLESLDHPNIVKFKSLVLDKKQGFLLMELFRAPNLKSQAQTDLLSVHVRLKRLIEQVSQAMAHIHDKGWLHKDLKPDNILFSKAAELRVIDFSLSSKMVTGMAAFFARKKKVIQGTRTYMAPEQIRGLKLGPYTDIYNFGITLFELLTGRTPFAGFTPNDLLKKHVSEPAPPPSMYNQNITPEMDRVILKMLAKKVDARHKTFNELLAEIRNVTLFKEPPEKLIEQRAIDKENEGQESNLSDRRDSRSDARRAEQAKVAAAEGGAPATPAAPVRIPVPPAAAGGAASPPGAPPSAPPSAVPVGAKPPGAPPASAPPGVAGRPPQSIPVGAPRPGMPPAPMPPGARPPGMPPGAMPVPPGGMPRPPGMPPPGGPRAPLPPGMVPPGMPPRPGVPAVAGGPPGGPPRPLPPGMPPNMPRPGGPPGVQPPGPAGLPRPPMPPGGMPGQPPRPGMPIPGPGAPPGVRPPMPLPPGGGPRPPAAPPPRTAAPPQAAPPSDEASLDDFQIN